MYNYRDSKSNINNILKSQTPIEKKNAIPADSAFTYENGILTWVASIFVDIENSTKLFNTKNEKLARLMRAFTSEVICIFQDIKNYNQIGIRGDCVYSIYDIKTTTPPAKMINHFISFILSRRCKRICSRCAWLLYNSVSCAFMALRFSSWLAKGTKKTAYSRASVSLPCALQIVANHSAACFLELLFWLS